MLKRLPQFLSAKFRKMKPGQILAIGFGATILLGALLLMLPLAHQDGQTVGFVDALFTATSATCVTGLTVVNTGLTYSLFGKIVIMVLIQVGGLGFMTMASLLFMALGRRISLRERLLIQESFNADSLQGVVRLVRNAVLVTFTIEAAAAVILSIRLVPEFGLGEGIFSAVFLSVSGFCNAGFDTFGFANSIEVYVGDPVINIVLMLLVFLGGLGFAVILDILKNRRFGRLMLHSRIVLIMTFALLLSGALLTALLTAGDQAQRHDQRQKHRKKLLHFIFPPKLSPERPPKQALYRMFTFYRNSPAITIVSYSEKSCRISRTAPTFRRFSACFVPPSRTHPAVPHPHSRHMSFSCRHIFRHFAQVQPLLFAFPTASSPPNTQNKPRGAAAGPVFLTYSRPWPHRLR